jgi:pantothenate synthetase
MFPRMDDGLALAGRNAVLPTMMRYEAMGRSAAINTALKIAAGDDEDKMWFILELKMNIALFMGTIVLWSYH